MIIDQLRTNLGSYKNITALLLLKFSQKFLVKRFGKSAAISQD